MILAPPSGRRPGADAPPPRYATGNNSTYFCFFSPPCLEFAVMLGARRGGAGVGGRHPPPWKKNCSLWGGLFSPYGGPFCSFFSFMGAFLGFPPPYEKFCGYIAEGKRLGLCFSIVNVGFLWVCQTRSNSLFIVLHGTTMYTNILLKFTIEIISRSQIHKFIQMTYFEFLMWPKPPQYALTSRSIATLATQVTINCAL